MPPLPAIIAPPVALPPLPQADMGHVLSHTQGLWEELRGRSLFITGGTGFFGHWLLESFTHANEELGLGARATVLSRDPAAFARMSPHLAARPDLTWLAGDVRDFPFPPGEFPYVIHAGTTSGSPVAPLKMFDTILRGTHRVLDFAARHGTRKLLFVSSGAVYGRQPPELTHLPEDYAGAPAPLDPASAYGAGKRAAELLCVLAAQQHGFEAKIARCFTFVGPHLPLDAHFAVGNFIRNALRSEPIRVNGDGSPFRSYLYAADLAIWLWTVFSRGQDSRAYNVGSPQAMPILEVAHAVREFAGGTFPVTVTQPRGKGPPLRYVPDTMRAEHELGLRSHVDLEDALRRTLVWHLGSRK